MWPQILSGVAIGSMYGLIAVGFQITYAVSNTMNFSQGAFVMVGAVLCYSFNITWGLPVWLAVPLTLLVAIALRMLFTKTLMGKMFQAVSENPETAQIMGVPVLRLVAFSFSLSTVMAGLAGMLIAPITNVSATMGTLLGLKAFAAAIIGGLGSPWGVMVAGVGYGVVESLAAGFFGGSYREIVGFAVVIGVLALRPNGLFGRAQIEKV